MTTQEIEDQIVEEFSLFEDWMDKYNYLIESGKSLKIIDPRYKDNSHLISGCQSKVWLHATFQDGQISFEADSDAVITKGLVNLLIRVFDNQTPDIILEARLDFIDKIGLKEHLSPTRSNGLLSMIKQIRLYAMAFKVKASASNQ